MVNAENERYIYKVLHAGAIFTYIHPLSPTDYWLYRPYPGSLPASISYCLAM